MNIMNKLSSIFLLVLVAYIPVSTSQELNTADTAGASVVVELLHRHLIEAMKNSDSLGFEGRYELLKDVVTQSFDTPLIVQVILSRYWSELDQGQKDSFIELFNRLSISTYASRFNGYDGEYFKETDKQGLRRQRLLVKTELNRENDTNVNMDYLLHEVDGKWLIISVIADGVNDLSLKRAEYAVVIKNQGFDGLVEEIETKISDMESGGNS
jgi:phospholipid transport system substrate-binding protein